MGYCEFYTLQIVPPDLAQWMRWGMGKIGFCKGHWAPISFPNTTSPRKAPGWGMRPTALGVLPLGSESRTRFVPSKICSPGRGPSRQAAPVWCPAKLWAEGGPSHKLVNAGAADTAELVWVQRRGSQRGQGHWEASLEWEPGCVTWNLRRWLRKTHSDTERMERFGA